MLATESGQIEQTRWTPRNISYFSSAQQYEFSITPKSHALPPLPFPSSSSSLFASHSIPFFVFHYFFCIFCLSHFLPYPIVLVLPPQGVHLFHIAAMQTCWSTSTRSRVLVTITSILRTTPSTKLLTLASGISFSLSPLDFLMILLIFPPFSFSYTPSSSFSLLVFDCISFSVSIIPFHFPLLRPLPLYFSPFHLPLPSEPPSSF